MTLNYFILFICIFMCPRRSYPLSVRNSIDHIPNASAETATFGDNRKAFVNYPHQNKRPLSQWVEDTMDSEENQGAKLDEEEPGFDLTPEEKAKFKIWPQGIIPYYIEYFSFDQGFREMVTSFLAKASGLTGLHFVQLQSIPTRAVRFVFFINRRGVLECQDYTTENFTSNGVQKVVLGYDCFSDGEGPGSLILALAGVPPMHRAPDRDSYVTFSPKNTIPDKIHLFDVLPDKDWIFHDIAYDWYSAGHYIWHKYTTNGHATIAPKKNQTAPLKTGEFKKLSRFDLWKIKMLYKYDLRKGHHVKKSQCNKLFRPGSNFSAYNPKSDEKLTPRPKPNKYLGIPDTVPEKPEDDDETTSYKPNAEKKKNAYSKSKRIHHSTLDQDFLTGSDFDSSEIENAKKPKT